MVHRLQDEVLEDDHMESVMMSLAMGCMVAGWVVGGSRLLRGKLASSNGCGFELLHSLVKWRFLASFPVQETQGQR